MHRFFVGPDAIREDRVIISGDEFNHLYRSLRLKPGDEIEVCDGQEGLFIVVIEEIEKDRAICSLARRLEIRSEPPVKVRLYQGLPKKDKLELVIQKGVELGVDQVIPFSAERSVVKLTPAKAQRRSERWQRIAMEAAKQSGRGRLTSVAVPMAFSDSVEKAVKESDWIIVPYEEEEITYLKEYLTRIELSLGDEAQTIKGEYPVISVFIGPEGGFSPREIVLLQDAGGQSVSIGPRILRTETAGIAVLTMILYHLGDLGEVK